MAPCENYNLTMPRNCDQNIPASIQELQVYKCERVR